ncbi:uncharacterized protein LOC115784438 [Archocentrus centrarchus]|uniref:uncharacterized protein LOC115784438 n=1 Tax=Archocentrus centrarchus TaxID=63155 RepID=UPI0011EA0704|nr:uncharacterized protein LOC115784438 [Archocentrus centrarchus]
MSTTPGMSNVAGRHPVDVEVSRLFTSRSSRRHQRRSNATVSLATYTHIFCCLGRKDSTVVPRRPEKECLQRAGLGERRICFRGDFHSCEELTDCLYQNFPKLRTAGGYELLKSSGNTRSRQLSVIQCPNEGYSVQYLKEPSTMIHHSIIYIRPLQCHLSLEPEETEGPSNTYFGPLTPCLLCGEEFPFSQIRQHNQSCSRRSQDDRERQTESENGEESVPSTSGASRSSSRQQVADIVVTLETGSDQAGPSTALSTQQPNPPDIQRDLGHAWITEVVPAKASELYIESVHEANKDKESLSFTLSLRDTLKERNRAILRFYKRPRVQWTNPLRCHLIGDAAIGEGVNRHVLSIVMSNLQNGFLLDDETELKTLLFEGEQDHLTPSTSRLLLERDFFVVAGRIIGHSFLNGGPCLVGLSQGIIHVLFGGEPETATVTESDCADQDVREVIRMLQGTKDLSEEETSVVLSLTLPWDLPGVTVNNRHWLQEKILLHAVLDRTAQQVKQIRRGLKDTGVWEFFSSRPDAVPVLFPRASEAEITPQMVIDNINWPKDEDIDEDILSLDDHCLIMSFLRRFIENGTSDILKSLLTFWTGWGVVCSNLEVEVIDCSLPQSSTCFLTLKLSKNHKNYEDFHQDLMASISSAYSGFGQI